MKRDSSLLSLSVERFAIENICRPEPSVLTRGFTPPSEQPQVNCGCSDAAASVSPCPTEVEHFMSEML